MTLPTENKRHQSSQEPTMSIVSLIAIVGAWGSAVTVASASGLLSQLSPLVIGPLILLGIFLPVVIYFRQGPFYRLMNRIGPHWIATFHVWRIAAALAFLYYGANGWLPQTFVAWAGWGDMLAGVLALFILVLPFRNMTTFGFHVVGFVDFIIAVGLGITFNLGGIPPMENITNFPIALIPWWLVGLSGASHIMSFEMLWRTRQENLAPASA